MVLGRIGTWRHVVVALSIIACVVLALFGVIGEGRHPELFESKQVVVAPAGDDGVRITEIVDQDFGSNDRHGYQRIIPTDFGVPVDVVASSPDAPDAVSVVPQSTGVRIRVGDPDTTVSGQHRYELSYTLPDARLSSGELALDIIGTEEELKTERFEIVVTGLELDNPMCSVGRVGTEGGCTLERDGDVYRAVISPLEPGRGITIGGTIVGRTDVVTPEPPPLPERRPDRRALVAAAMVPLGLIGGIGVFLWTRRAGRNEVYAGGAADAAYGDLPGPGQAGPADPGRATVLVADDKMDELATIEFVPPKGIEPWQGAVLLSERINDSTVAAWFSGLAAREVITLTDDDGDLVIGKGPRFDAADRATSAHLSAVFDGDDTVTLGTYDKGFATAWSDIRAAQIDSIAHSHWWKRLPPSGGQTGDGAPLIVLAIVAFVVFGMGTTITAALGLFRSIPLALVFGLVVPAITAFFVYGTLRAARTATGSALTLRTESFRRFLDASEGKHVEWAWTHGVLREYSAWAVALDEADAWNDALSNANVPEPARLMTTPLLVYSMGSAFRSTTTAPSSSGSGGGFSGGGFSGGSVGGGGGGGSSGSW